MRLRRERSGWIGLLGLLTSGCASVSTLQTAKTLDPQASEFSIGGAVQKVSVLDEVLDDGNLGRFVFAEVMYRRGLVENFDMGVKGAMPGNLVVDGKFQFFSQDSWVLSTGLGLGYASQMAFPAKTSIVEVIVPLYTGYDIGDKASLYLSPKYLLRYSLENKGERFLMHIPAATAGARFGSDVGIYVEGTFGQAFGSSSTTIRQLNASVAYR